MKTEDIEPAQVGHPAPAGEQGRALKLWVILARTYAVLARKAEADVTRHGLSATEFGILEVIYHKGPLLLGQVQRKMLVSSGGVTYLVDRLTEKGLVQRLECPGDRRARYAALTPRGTELMDRVFPEHAKAITAALAGLNSAEQDAAIGLLRTLGHSSGELSGIEES